MSTLARLKELEAEATPAPWPNWNEIQSLKGPHGELRPTVAPMDAALITEMRNALPKLLAFVEAYDRWDQLDPNEHSYAPDKSIEEMIAARKALES